MLFDVDISYRADFVPRRGRNVRRGHAVETATVDVPEATDGDAPVVLIWGKGKYASRIRASGGLLFEPTEHERLPDTYTPRMLKAHATSWMRASGFHPGKHREPHEQEDGSSTVASHRDVVLARLAEWAREELLLVDGRLHRRAASPMIPIADLEAVYGAQVRNIQTTTSSPFVSAWFPPTIAGKSLREMLVAPGREENYRGRRMIRTDEMEFRLALWIVNPEIHEAASKDPRNVRWSKMADEAMVVTKEKSSGRAIDFLFPFRASLDSLLEAVASNGASDGQTEADTWQALRNIAGIPAAFDPKATTIDPRKFVPEQDFERFAHGHEGPGSERIERDSWNMRVVATEIMDLFDGRLGQIAGRDVDALARIVVHLRDWRISPASVFQPEREEEFVRNVAVLERLLDDPLFFDVGEEWQRIHLRETIEKIRMRTAASDSKPLAETDESLRDFSF